MDFDTTPSSIIVSDCEWDGQTLKMYASDKDGQKWLVTLFTGFFGHGAKYWFAQTVKSRIKRDEALVTLTSRYDEDADEWFVQVGNYGIYSKDLHFTEMV